MSTIFVHPTRRLMVLHRSRVPQASAWPCSRAGEVWRSFETLDKDEARRDPPSGMPAFNSYYRH